ncbi:MAG TPA: hypothetical protein PKE47_01360 [Verrucomicrobiota bacterium]|nr:hypothetical protein [Verrucomicrobiota bacterium]
MKTACISFLMATACLVLPAAPPQVSDHVFGGSGEEGIRDVLPLPDGGLLLGGTLFGTSTNGNRTAASHGDTDFWIVRLDAAQQPLWDRVYGGAATDELRRMVALRDGGFLLIGGSASEPGGTRTAAREGGFDGWIVHIAEDGTPLWDRAYGGPDADRLDHGVELPDGGFLLVGTSSSEPGPAKTAALFGASDAWAVRVDARGNRLWDRSYGGAFAEESHAVIADRDGGSVVAGWSDSRPEAGNKTSPAHGQRDAWVLRLNDAGDILWDRSLGGRNEDWATDVVSAPDGGLLVVGNSLSREGGTKTSPNWSPVGGTGLASDGWLNRLDPAGTLLWDRSYGGEQADGFQRGVAGPGGYVFAGSSSSAPGGTKTSPKRFTEPFGSDGWAARVDLEGRPVWDQSYGASLTHDASALVQLADGSWFLTGRGLGGTNGTRTVPGFGGADGYAVRLADDEGRLAAPTQTAEEIAAQGFRLTLTGVSNLWYRVERSPDLVRWGALATNQGVGGPHPLTDEEATNILRRFYRTRLLATP